MVKLNNISKGAMFSSIASFFQLIPVFFSNFFIGFTIFSTIPIYLTARIRLRLGVICYITTGLVVLMFSKQDFLVFMFINGLMGLIIGVAEEKIKNWVVVTILSSCLLAVSIFVLDLVFSVTFIDDDVKFNLITEGVIVYLGSLVYIILLRVLLHYCFKNIKRIVKI